MARQPIGEKAMSGAERQKRHREMLKSNPWLDPKRQNDAMLCALKYMYQSGEINNEQMERLISLCLTAMEIHPDQMIKARSSIMDSIFPENRIEYREA